jgi:hypothetical protein
MSNIVTFTSLLNSLKCSHIGPYLEAEQPNTHPKQPITEISVQHTFTSLCVMEVQYVFILAQAIHACFFV